MIQFSITYIICSRLQYSPLLWTRTWAPAHIWNSRYLWAVFSHVFGCTFTAATICITVYPARGIAQLFGSVVFSFLLWIPSVTVSVSLFSSKQQKPSPNIFEKGPFMGMNYRIVHTINSPGEGVLANMWYQGTLGTCQDCGPRPIALPVCCWHCCPSCHHDSFYSCSWW